MSVRWTKVVCGGVVTALFAVTPGPAYAVTPSVAAPPDDVEKARAAVLSLATVLGGVATLPQLATPLPLTGQAPADVLGLATAFSGSPDSLAGAMQAFLTSDDNQTWDDLEAALDAADVAGVGIDATVAAPQGTSTTATVTLDVGGSEASGKAYLVHAGDTGTSTEGLFLDGTAADSGAVTLKGSVTGRLVLSVDLDAADGQAATLAPASALTMSLAGSNADLALPSRYGFSDVAATGSAAFDLDLDLPFADPDGSGAITRAEWEQTLVGDLVDVSVDDASTARVALSLDSDLVDSDEDGTLDVDLAGAQLAVTDNGDGTASYAAPTASFEPGLRDLARVSASDAIVTLAQLAAVYATAQSRIDPRLPFADRRVSEMVDLVAPVNRLVEAQGAAAVACGRVDTNPPSATTIPGSTWFCQARTADAVVADSVQWSLDGPGELGANATSDDTVGQDPTTNVVVTGTATEPDISVEFEVADEDGQGVTFTAQRRVRTAQELESRLAELDGAEGVGVGYDADSRSLAFDLSLENDPAATTLPIVVADLFRPDAHLRGVELPASQTMSVDVGATSLDTRFGLLLAPDGDTVGVADRAFLQVTDQPELSIASLSGAAASFDGAGSVGFVPVDVDGSDLSLSSTGLSADIAGGTLTAVGGDAPATLADAALISDVLADDVPGVTGSVLTGKVDASASATVEVTAGVLPAAAQDASATFTQSVDLTTPTDAVPALPTVAPDASWEKWVAPLDLTPQVTGRSESSEAGTTTLTARGTTAFLAGDFGVDFGADDVESKVVNATLFNLTTGATCPRFEIVDDSTLRCVDVDLTTPVSMAGGRRPNPDADARSDDDPDNDTVEDNTWAAGDEFLVEGDPTTVRGILFDGLYDLANGIENSTEATWNGALPLLGLRPRDLTPQLAQLRTVAADLGAASNVPCVDDEATGTDECEGKELAPSDLTKLEKVLQEKVDELAGDAADEALVRVSVSDEEEALDGVPHLVLRVSLPAKGTVDAPLTFRLPDPTGYWLRRSPVPVPAPEDPSAPLAVPVDWSSTVDLDIAVPLADDQDPGDVKVLPSTGVSDLRLQVDETEVDLTGSLGPVNVDIGKNATVTGTHQVVTGTNTDVPLEAGTATFSGTSTGTAAAVVDEARDFAALEAAGALTGATVTNARTGTSCTPGAVDPASPSTLPCALPDTGTGDEATATPWSAGDRYTVTTSSARTLVDTDLAGGFDGAGVVAGMVVVTSGDGATGSCVVASVAGDHLVCAADLSGGAAFGPDRAYRVLDPTTVVDDQRTDADPATATPSTWSFADLVASLSRVTGAGDDPASCAPSDAEGAAHTATTLVCDEPAATATDVVTGWDKDAAYTLDFGDPTTTVVQLGARFDEQSLVGQPVTNTTDGTSCIVASATRDSLTCATPLADEAGAATGQWDAGDDWLVGGLGVAKADLTYDLNADVDPADAPTVDAYVADLAGSLTGPATALDCGDLVTADETHDITGDACALLSVRIAPTGPDGDFPDGRFLGTLGYAATAAGGTGGGTGLADDLVTTTDGIEGLQDSEITLGFDLAGIAVEQLGGAVQSLLDGTVADEPMPLLGYDATGGSWLDPALDELSWALDEALPDGMAPAGATVGDLDGDGDGTAGLEETIKKAVEDAIADVPAMLPVEGIDVGLIQDVDVTLLCDEAKCGKDARLGEVDDMNLSFVFGENAVAGTNPGEGCDQGCGDALYEVPFSAGLPGIPVEADFNVNSQVGWKLKVDVGVDRTNGPYVNVSEDQLTMGAGVTIPGPNGSNEGCPDNPLSDEVFTSATSPFKDYQKTKCQAVTLGILQATAWDSKSDPSHLDLGLSLDLDELDGTDEGRINAGQLGLKTERDQLQRGDTVELSAEGAVNWYFVTGINTRSVGLTEGSLPSVHGTFALEWKAGGSAEDLTAPDATIEFDDMYLDGGSVINKFAGPLLRDVNAYVKPYKPVIDTVRAPIPVLSDLAIMFGGAQLSLLDVLEGVSGNDLSLVRNVLDILDVIANMQDVAGTVLIPLGPGEMPEYQSDWPKIPTFNGAGGSFKLLPKQVKNGPCGGKMTAAPSSASTNGANGVGAPGTTQGPAVQSQTRTMPKDCESRSKSKGGYRSKTTVVQTQPCDATTGCTGKERARTITRWSQRPQLTGTALTFPFLNDPSEIFGMLVGEDATLARLDLGTLQASAGIGISFGPFMAGPVPVDIGVGVSVRLGAHLALGYDTLGLRNALLSDPGVFQPERLLDGLYIDDYDAAGNETPEMFAVLTVQLEGSVSIRIFKAGVYGGVSLTIAGDLNDPNGDGKMRIQEIRSFNNPMCMFGLSGYLEFFLGAFVQVDLFIKTFRYNFEFYRSPKVKLFEIKCAPQPPQLARKVDNDLRLNVGADSSVRYYAMDEKRERYRVRQLSAIGAGPEGGTLVSVEAFGLYQEKVVPATGKITADAGTENDVIEFLPGVDLANVTHDFTLAVDVKGGSGDDTVSSGLGDDTLAGGDGNDRLTSSSGKDTVAGDAGNDTISAGLGDDTVNGGEGDDVVSGDAGGDTLYGDAGNDTVSGGPGLDDTQLARLVKRENSVRTQQGRPAVSVADAAFQALLDRADTIAGGAGDDTLTGHVGDDLIFGDDVPTGAAATDTSGDTFRAKACLDSAGGGTGDDSIDGQVGDDRVAGGPGNDALTGSSGHDTLCGNEGDDLLDGDEGATGTPVGRDDLRGGSGDDRVFGRDGGDRADGGPGSDLVDGGPGHDVLTGGTGSDAMTGADGHDVVVGDGATVSGVTPAQPAGVTDLGISDTTDHGRALAGRVSDVTGSGTAVATVCADRVNVRGGRLDLDGDGVAGASDDGRFDGFAVVDGWVDVDGDGTVDGDDSAVVAGLPVIAGELDVPADQLVSGLGISGSGDADCLLGQAGNDAVLGGGAGDRIDAGVGDDHADGGAGDDRVRGEQGDDDLHGGAGADEMYGDRGRDLMRGDAGDDTVYGGIDDDEIEGNQDDDLLSGGDGGDVLVGGTSTAGTSDGDDRIDGGAGIDHVAGDNAAPVRVAGVFKGLRLLDLESSTAAGGDVVRAGPAADVVHGQGGDDTLFGDDADDRVEGGPGDDKIDGGTGADSVVGGSGAHLRADGTVQKLPGTLDGDDQVQGGTGTDTVLGDNGLATAGAPELFDVPLVTDRGTTAAPAVGVAGDDAIDGGPEADVVFGQSGDDTVLGSAGDDDLAGNAGSDSVSGGDGVDQITGGSRTAGVVDDQARTVGGVKSPVNDVVDGGPGDDVVTGDNAGIVAGVVTLHDVPDLTALGATALAKTAGTFGDDLVLGGSGDDRLWGQSGHDRVEGGDGDDVAEGNSGADDVLGGSGDDDLYGGSTQADVDDARATVAGAERGDYVAGGEGADVALGDNGLVEHLPVDLGTVLPFVDSTGTTRVTEHDVEFADAGRGRFPGASGPDQILGEAGTDRLFGQGGDDTVLGGSEDDEISGGSGADHLEGQAGADDIVGGSGQSELPVDMARVLDGADVIHGAAPGDPDGDGADVAIGDNGSIARSGGDDPNTGSARRTVHVYDVAMAGSADVPTTVAGDDQLFGGPQRDLLHGQGGKDTVRGDDGDDWLEGNASDDQLFGGAGDDDLLGGSSAAGLTDAGYVTGTYGVPGAGGLPQPTNLADGADALWGDDGDDAVVGDNGHVERLLDNAGRWTYLAYEGGELLKRDVLGANAVERAGAFGNDVAHGGNGHDEVHGQLGDDQVEGNSGQDVVLGDLGHVVTSVNSGRQKVIDANNFITSTTYADGTLHRATELYPVPTSSTDQRGGGADVVLGGLGDDVLHGGAGHDQMWGNRELDSALRPVVGTTGSRTALDEDAIFGGMGDDVMWGGPDHDRLYGGHGADWLDVVTNLRGDPTVDFVGADHMYGGWGPDGMQADVSKPSPGQGVDKMVDATGAYNGYFVCEGAYGGNSVMRTLSPAMESFWQSLAASDGLVEPVRSGTSGWWELSMVFNSDRGQNANPVFEMHPAHFVCDTSGTAPAATSGPGKKG